MTPGGRNGLVVVLALLVLVSLVLAVVIGEVPLSLEQYRAGISDATSGPAVVLWQVRAPRGVCAFAVGAALGLSGAVLQGLLRNPLADPGVLGVSGTAALGAALAIVAGLAAIPGAVELAALAGAGLAAAILVPVAARLKTPEALILFGVALSSFAGAVTALVFNLSPSPIATAEILSWMLGSVQNRSWPDVAWVMPMLSIAAVTGRLAMPGLRALTLGDEAAQTSGLDIGRLRVMALVCAALATGAAVAVSGMIGFVGLAAPHLVRRLVRADPGRILLPSALAGGLMLTLADILVRITPTDQEVKLGVFTALVGAPLFALIAWRAAREWQL